MLSRHHLFFKVILVAICLLSFSVVRAQNDTTNYAIREKLTSRFYFPGSLGVSVPFKNTHTVLKSGLAFNTAAEYRPLYINAVFFRINYDALNNQYKSYVLSLPTNIVQGNLSTQFIVIGAGYRKRLDGCWALYGLAEPGVCIRSFDRSLDTPQGIVIENVSTNCFAIKADLGLEYYIGPHFAAVMEPSFYKLLSDVGFNAYHARFLAFNIGITTTIF